MKRLPRRLSHAEAPLAAAIPSAREFLAYSGTSPA
jgi:hypothetical protein